VWATLLLMPLLVTGLVVVVVAALTAGNMWFPEQGTVRASCSL
jgi:hypothetical protein